MTDDALSFEEREILLKIARESLESKVIGKPQKPLYLGQFPQKLRELGATFVTLTKGGKLRGCIGTLEAYRPLVEDVRYHAVAAATQDYRFPPVNPDELGEINIEVSRLTKPTQVSYKVPEELVSMLRPGLDGVVVKDGDQRATFLPQVWNTIPDPIVFLNQLCRKMGSPADIWRKKKLEVYTYRVEEFHE